MSISEDVFSRATLRFTSWRRTCGLLLGITVGFALTAFAYPVKITHGPVVEHTDPHDATIAWSTNTSSATIVRYGTDPKSLGDLKEMPWGALTHRVTLSNLQAGTTYYFQADSSDGDATASEGVSTIGTFTTPSDKTQNQAAQNPVQLRLTSGPSLQDVGGTTVTIAWSTTLPSSSVVKYGTSLHDLSQTAEEPWGATEHHVQLKNLLPHTQYYYSVHSAQGKGAPGQAIDTPPVPFTTEGANH